MKKVYQGMMGAYKLEDEKHEGTHALLTLEDYNDLKSQISSLKSQLADEKQAHADDVEEEQRQAKATCDSYKKQCLDKISEWKQYAETCNVKQEQAERLNINLKRICKENANAKRGIKPKKERSGFIVTATAEIFERVKVKKNMKEHRAYKSIVETPYNELMPLTDELKEGAWDDGLNELFDSSWKDTDSPDYLSAIDDERKDKNFIYKQNWRTNKNGFWEIECYHTKPMNLSM